MLDFIIAVLSLILYVGLMVLGFLYLKKRGHKMSFRHVLSGTMCYMMIMYLFGNGIITGIKELVPFFSGTIASSILYGVISSVMLFLIYLMMEKLFLRERINEDTKVALSFGCALGEAVFSLLSPMLTYVVIELHIGNGTINDWILTNMGDMPEESVEAIATYYQNIGSSYVIFMALAVSALLIYHQIAGEHYVNGLGNKKIELLWGLLFTFIFNTLYQIIPMFGFIFGIIYILLYDIVGYRYLIKIRA